MAPQKSYTSSGKKYWTFYKIKILKKLKVRFREIWRNKGLSKVKILLGKNWKYFVKTLKLVMSKKEKIVKLLHKFFIYYVIFFTK